MRLELIPLPVADVDRSKAFYAGTLGFVVDHDVTPSEGMRIVQLTPPGSACSVVIGTGMSSGSQSQAVRGLHLVVDDIVAVRSELVGRGAAVSEIDDLGGVRHAYLSDPDGNSWVLQQIDQRR